jgi:RNA polymerase sigma-70 factor, ECF subfamily
MELRTTGNSESKFMEQDDEVLVHAARAGDRQAFERLYQRYAPVVHGVLLARVPYSEVEDLLQNVFLLAFRRFPQLREDAAFGGWLLAIARNQAADYHRHKVDEEPLLEHHQNRASGEDSSDMSPGELLHLLQSLPETYRETLALRLVEGLTGPEIASRIGMTHGSVRVNLSRGMHMLRELVEKGVRS